MKLFLSYLKSNLRHILAYLFVVATFGFTFFLYSTNIDAIAYATLLSLCFGLIYLFFNYLKFKNEHKELVRLMKVIDVSISELKYPNDLIQIDYFNIIQSLYTMKVKGEQEKIKTITDSTEYYTVWAHQIKTPISAMHLLLEQNPNDELSMQLFKIEEYVEMVLTYIRSESSSTDYVIKENDIYIIVRSALRKYAKIFIQKKISLNYEPVDLKVITDMKWMQFVIEQILSNSLKYMSKGSISIYKENDNTLVIEDTGIGIAPEDLPRICEKGFTGYTGRANQKSTGIGLYLCKRILTNLSHSIKIESTVDIGTKVKIIFSQSKYKYE